jgi:hypothetical protein
LNIAVIVVRRGNMSPGKYRPGVEVRPIGGPKPVSLLKHKIPVRLIEWDIAKTGYLEMDLVVHCGSSTFRDYINALSTTEVS